MSEGMPAMLTQQGDAYPTAPDGSQPTEPGRPLDTHYYLTEGLEGVEHHEYRDIRSFKGAVDSRRDELGSGNSDEYLPPYLIFSPVTQGQLANIDRVRNTGYKALRFLYLNEPKVLIVKYMPSPVHQMAAKEFGYTIRNKIEGGGQGAEISSMGSTNYRAKASGKEPDGSLRPLRARPNLNDWPTIIFECGMSETPHRLKVDGRWWIENSSGAVKIVLLLFVSVREKAIRVELWKQDTVKNPQEARGNDKDEVTATGPTLRKTINITPGSVTGAPLKLKFRDIFLRKPKEKRGEANYVITEHDMRRYYNHIWPPAPEASYDFPS